MYYVTAAKVGIWNCPDSVFGSLLVKAEWLKKYASAMID